MRRGAEKANAGRKLKITIDDKIDKEGIFNGAIVANGKYFGSGMKIAPHAEPNDGLFDVVILGDMGKVEIIFKFGKIRSGTHIYEDKVEVTRAKKVTVETQGDAFLDVDGEVPGKCPAEFSMVAQAIEIIIS